MTLREKAIVDNINDRIRYAQNNGKDNTNAFQQFQEQIRNLANKHGLLLSDVLTSKGRISKNAPFTLEELQKLNQRKVLKEEYTKYQRQESQRAKEENREYSSKKAISEYQGYSQLEEYMNTKKGFVYEDAKNGYAGAQQLNEMIVDGLRVYDYKDIMPLFRDIISRHENDERANPFLTGKEVQKIYKGML